MSVSRTYWTGQIRYRGYVFTGSGEVDEVEYAAMCLAGMEAEALYLMEEQGMRKGKALAFAEGHAGTDLRHAREVAGGIRGGLRGAEKKARRLVESRWQRITRLAHSLA